MRLADLRGQRLAVLGYGREGRAVVRELRRDNPNADLTVWVETGDLPADLPGHRGPLDGDKLAGFDVLIRSPGVPVDHPALQQARQSGCTVLNPASIWFSEHPGRCVVGVTGSKGKSTTASLLAALLAASGREVALAGNIGRPLLDWLERPAEVTVVELSSYQLSDLQGRLSLGVITRLFEEHLDWHGSREAYFACKLRLADLLEGRPLIINAADPVLRQATDHLANRLLVHGSQQGIHRQGSLLMDGQSTLLSLDEMALKGRHNLDNAGLALAAGQWLGCPIDTMLAAVRSFGGLSHRLELLGRCAGLDWVNDSIATSPHATRAALEAFEGRRVILMAGGMARPADWSVVADWCRAQPLAGLVTLPDTGDQVAAQLVAAGAVDPARHCRADNLGAAIEAAAGLASGAEVVLLSPGAPSFPYYRDFEDRGEQLRQALEVYRLRSTA
ncbi:MAG: UDP-N-acetylmuramoyl-L-alanine--D-glutamate ligase [Wenzhouxiangella sp.]